MFGLRYLDRGRHLKRREVKSRAGGVNPARLFCSTYAAGKEVTYWWQYCRQCLQYCRGYKFERKTFKLLIGGSTASNACSMPGYNNE